MQQTYCNSHGLVASAAGVADIPVVFQLFVITPLPMLFENVRMRKGARQIHAGGLDCP